MPDTVLVFGAGYSGKAFAAARADPATTVFGTTRSQSKTGALRDAGITPLVFDGEAFAPELKEVLAEATHLIVSIGPDERGDPVLRAAGQRLQALAPRLRWIAYLSTVGVYGDAGGRWVDERTPVRPGSDRSRQRVAAERAWSSFSEETGVPVAVLRLSGIYGPGRNAFINLQEGTAKRLVKPGQVFNRIHAADIGGALWHLCARRLDGVFNVTDDLPAPPQDVVAHAAGLMGVAAPPAVDFDAAQLSPMARSFYGENKRVSNARLKGTGYGFLYPDYRAALAAMWRDGNWRGEAADRRSPIRAAPSEAEQSTPPSLTIR